MRGVNRSVRAVTLERKGLLTLKNYPYPELQKGPTMIKIEYSSICEIDKHSFKGFLDQLIFSKLIYQSYE